MKGRLVMADGLDGSGKGVIVDALGEWSEAHGLNVLDIRGMNELPEPDELGDYGAILSAEPTFSLVGKAIRDEMVRENNRKYSGWSLAYAFSIDREILYKRIIIPSLAAGRHVFQERGVITSFIYQPVQEHIQLADLMRLPGNKLALQYSPDLLMVCRLKPEEAIQRLGVREKKDNSIFDNLAFQQKISERYGSDWLKALFEKQGSKVVYIDTGRPAIAETKQAAIAVWEEFLSSRKG